MPTVNATFKIDEFQLTEFESWFRNHYNVVDLKILPETEQLYLNDPIFKKLVLNVKTCTKLRDEYINKMNV